VTSEGDHLARALVCAYGDYVRDVVARRNLGDTEGLSDAIEKGRGWLRTALGELLGRPYPLQDRGPLEIFQEALRFPTKVLERAGHPPAPRDLAAANALPGDLYDLAPVSSRDLGEAAWSHHLAWGLAKAVAMTRRTVGILTRNLMDRSKLEAGLTAAGWVTVPLKGRQAAEGLDALVVDLEHPAAFGVLESADSKVAIVAYGPHVDATALERARRVGASHALPRSVVFRDVTALAVRLAQGRS